MDFNLLACVFGSNYLPRSHFYSLYISSARRLMHKSVPVMLFFCLPFSECYRRDVRGASRGSQAFFFGGKRRRKKITHKTFPRGSKDALAASATAGLPAGTRSFLPHFFRPNYCSFSPLLHFLSLVSALCFFWFTYMHARSK